MENVIKQESGIADLHGSELASKAFSVKYDKNSSTIIQKPAIAINSLSNESELNEQDGIMHMLMGFFRGPRNIYQHNKVKPGFDMCFSILIETSYFLDVILDKKSLLSKPKWIKVRYSPKEIYYRMPKKLDRLEYLLDCLKKGLYRLT